MKRQNRKLGLQRETIRVLGDMRLVAGGRAKVSQPTDEMGVCGGCATAECTGVTECPPCTDPPM